MKIVINISEEEYKKISNNNPSYADDFSIYYAIKNGTPLPKNHGRLGDLDALEKEIVNGIKAGNYEEGYETFAHINDMDDCVECVKYAPTIIEAESEEEE